MTRASGRRPIRSRRSRVRVVPLTQVPPKRLWIIFWILAAGLLGLVGRMAWLQLVQAPDLEQRARQLQTCLLYTSPSPRDATLSRMPSSA